LEFASPVDLFGSIPQLLCMLSNTSTECVLFVFAGSENGTTRKIEQKETSLVGMLVVTAYTNQEFG